MPRTSRAAPARRAARWPLIAVSALAGSIAAAGLALMLMPTDRQLPAHQPVGQHLAYVAGAAAARVAATVGYAQAFARFAMPSQDDGTITGRGIDGGAGIAIVLRPHAVSSQGSAGANSRPRVNLIEPSPGLLGIVVENAAHPPATGTAAVTFPLGHLSPAGDEMEVALLQAGLALRPAATGPLRAAERHLMALPRSALSAPGVLAIPTDGAGTAVRVAWTPIAGTELTAVAALSVAPDAASSAFPASVLLVALLGGVLGILAMEFARLHDDRQNLATTLGRARRDHDAAIRALAKRQDLETLGRFTAGVAHDMGNVMQVVETYLRAIPGAAGDPREMARLLDRARGAARRGANGARDLLAIARSSSRRPRPVDVPSLLAELADVMQELLGETYTVRLDVPASLPAALADPGDLEAMLVNLATNSRDAMAAAGSGTLTISAALIGSPDATEPDDASSGGEWIRIDIVDNGIGMDAETLANAMEPFFTTKPRGRGTGLGLALAREFAERSGGMLEIESAPGVGTRASLLLRPASHENLADDAAVPDRDVTLNAVGNAAPQSGAMHMKG